MSALDFDSSQNSDQDISSQASNYPEPESQEFFVIEKILNHRDKRPIYDKQLKRLITAREYLIKWQGFSDEHNTWEPYANLIQDSPIMIKRYEETIKEDKIRHKQLEFAKLGLDAKFRRNKGNLANQSLLETEINSQNILSDGKTENIQSKISESSTDDSTSSKKPKINLKINLKKYRNSAELVSELPDQEMLNYEIVQIEPPAGENPDQLIYLIQHKYTDKKHRITSQNLQKLGGEIMICQWLEKVLHPYIKSECEKMLNELKKGKQFYQLRVVSD